MKRLMITMAMMMTIVVSAAAMSYSRARSEALFLTDKMAYELSLTDEQYEAAYEINLDYLMSVGDRNDFYGTRWNLRNRNLRYVLDDYQYSLYYSANYFYRPLSWLYDGITLNIYSRYADRNMYYCSRPSVYFSYRGGHQAEYYARRSYSQPRGNAVRMQSPRNDVRMASMNNNNDNRSFGNGRRVNVSSISNNRGSSPSFSNGSRQQQTVSFGGADRSSNNVTRNQDSKQSVQANARGAQRSQNNFGGRR